jgi:hypothetical protein
MKIFIIASTLLLTLSGCISVAPYSFRNYTIGRIDSCNVGDPIISIQDGVRDKLQNSFFGYERELIYTGISNNTISLMYREYYSSPNGTYIRPAFSMPLQYDLNVSSAITFKEFSIEIANATTKQIKYSVVQDSQAGVGKSRQMVKIVLKTGAIYDVYLVEETEDNYKVKQEYSDNSTINIMKKLVKSITPIR